MMDAVVRVGFTKTRPVIPDEFTTTVYVSAESEAACRLVACQMLACQKGGKYEDRRVEMVTSARIVELEL